MAPAQALTTALALCAAGASAFTGAFAPQRAVAARRPHSCTQIHMGGAKGVSSTRAGKATTVEKVRELLSTATFVFAVQSSRVTGKQVTELRKALPEGTTARVVKNKLMRIAAADTQFKAVEGDLTKGENMWFFVQDDLKGSLELAKKFAKDINKMDTHLPRYGVIDGGAVDAEAIEKLSQLPSKKELYQRIASSIKAVPTKVAKGINLVPTKVARAVKLATAPEDGAADGAAAAEEAAAEA